LFGHPDAVPKNSRVDEDALRDLIERRRQVLRRSEIEGCGMPPSTITDRTRPGGMWQRILPGIVLTFNGPPSLQHRIRAALRYARGGAIVSGLTALRLRGFRDLPSTTDVHLLIPHRHRHQSTSYVVIERTRRRPHHCWIQGIPCAPTARAVIDAARRMASLDAVRAIMAEAVRQGHCTIDQLTDEVRQAGNRRTKIARMVLCEVAAGIRSVAEAKARTYMARAGIPEPLWNHDVFDADGNWIARPDAIWPELGVVLEIDSMAWHLSPLSYLRTQARQARMTKTGILVIPVAPAVLINDTQDVMQTIIATHDAARTRPAPVLIVRAPANAAA
jgi:hypothetical protein